ncbi:MAG: hypothetical protein ACP5R5_12105, partial [Armatimonadota bacterium]
IAIGITTTAVSFLLQYVKGNFMDVAQKVNLFFVAPLGALFMMAFFVKRANRYGAWASIAAGFAVGVVMAYYGEIYAFFTGVEMRSTFTYTLAAALVASLVVGYAVSRAFPVTQTHSADQPGPCACGTEGDEQPALNPVEK